MNQNGMPQIMDALGGQQLQDPRQQMMDWRAQRPDRQAFAGPDAYRQAKMDWRGLRPERAMRALTGSGVVPGTPGVAPGGVPPVVPGQPQIMPPVNNGIGASYGVQNIVPSSNPYQFPTYRPGY